jgi:hypothetical protein
MTRGLPRRPRESLGVVLLVVLEPLEKLAFLPIVRSYFLFYLFGRI